MITGGDVVSFIREITGVEPFLSLQGNQSDFFSSSSGIATTVIIIPAKHVPAIKAYALLHDTEFWDVKASEATRPIRYRGYHYISVLPFWERR